jgi:predicted nucleic acid-binding Zn ribbon protein
MPTYAYRCEQCRETFERIETTISKMAEVRIAQLSRVGFVMGHLK